MYITYRDTYVYVDKLLNWYDSSDNRLKRRVGPLEIPVSYDHI